MSQSSPRLDLPYLQPAQAQKHVTHNEAVMRLDALVQLVLQHSAATVPPADPLPGAAYGLGAGAVAAWSGQDGMLAIWQGEGWLFLPPAEGWRAWDLAAGAYRLWDGSAWVTPQQQDRLGLSTSADETNRLAVASAAALFTHAGAGHQLKINKASDTETASLLFQSNWSGHAELGLAGSRDFSIKVSDGGSWQEALVVEADTARVGLGTANPGARLALAHGGSGDDYLVAGEASALFRLAADGNGSCAGAWSGGGADFAEYFEWADGNPDAEDRRGLAVVLTEAGHIRPARNGETPIGVISSHPCVIGNDDGGQWPGRFLRDAYGSPLRDATGQPRLAPDFDPETPYQPRATRPDWALVGLTGRLRLRAGQPVDPRWIKIQDVAPDPQTKTDLEDWLIR
jgi:hypothetical protein